MKQQNLINTIEKACSRIAPAWPLKNVVAVNPFLGIADTSFKNSVKLMHERSGINLTMPLEFYLKSISEKQITEDDISKSLLKNNKSDFSVQEFLHKVQNSGFASNVENGFRVKTIIDIAEEITGTHWNDFMIDKVSTWASSYFDESQMLWNTTNSEADLFNAWKEDAQTDLSTELNGIKNFRSLLKKMPTDYLETASEIINKLSVSEEILEIYLHTLLMKILGWSSYTAGVDWDSNLYNNKTNHLQSFLSIILFWELSLFENLQDKGIKTSWEVQQIAIIKNQKTGSINEHLETRIILQDAYDLGCERILKENINNNGESKTRKGRPKVQAVFCIDVRSEVYRRNLEKVDPQIETLGFAGFFGFPIKYVPLGHTEGKNQCPVLIPSGPVVKEVFSENEKAKKTRLGNHQVNKTWRAFKSGAISSFGFVSPLGIYYLPKLVSDAFGFSRPTSDPKTDGLKKHFSKGRDIDVSGIPLGDKINMAASAISAMGLKNRIASLVLITGHGSSSVNNPHASGLDCGACGGHSGEINAMTAEKILNDRQVREGLNERGIHIPSDTHFLAAIHNTTTDEINLIGEDRLPSTCQKILADTKLALKLASNAARQERSSRLNISSKTATKSILKRSKDWSQVRPEWGLAGCNSFIIAPRHRTLNLNLGGKSFLHSYNWQEDEEFKILETIMTAPMVVTSWINLQYYASTTDNIKLGAGNKTLHNVTGGIGVLEGSAGDLRIGLPWQSIHDGKAYQHLPQRLNVFIEAPIEAITNVLRKHASVKNLCDNAWIKIFSIDSNGKISNKYERDYNWEEPTIEQEEKNKELVLM